MSQYSTGHPSENTVIADVRSAFEILAAGAPAVAKSLVDIATNGKSELARYYAATAVLDRVGLPARVDVGITATSLIGVLNATAAETAVDTVKARLQQLREQSKSQQVIEGGVVLPFPSITQVKEEGEE